MANKKMWLGFPPTHPSFRPYVTAIGQAAVAWNGLHETLRSLFWYLSGGIEPRTHAAIWNSIRSDRSQRAMLRAIAKSNEQTGKITGTQYQLIIWLLDRCNSLAEARDDAVHAPLIAYREGIFPNSAFGNPRASNLLNKDLLSEFRWCRDTALVLSDFCGRLDWHFCQPRSYPSPEIPALPNRGRKTSRPNPRRQPRKESRQSPPQS
jgi:hypothetical protein